MLANAVYFLSSYLYLFPHTPPFISSFSTYPAGQGWREGVLPPHCLLHQERRKNTPSLFCILQPAGHSSSFCTSTVLPWWQCTMEGWERVMSHSCMVDHIRLTYPSVPSRPALLCPNLLSKSSRPFFVGIWIVGQFFFFFTFHGLYFLLYINFQSVIKTLNKFCQNVSSTKWIKFVGDSK